MVAVLFLFLEENGTIFSRQVMLYANMYLMLLYGNFIWLMYQTNRLDTVMFFIGIFSKIMHLNGKNVVNDLDRYNLFFLLYICPLQIKACIPKCQISQHVHESL